VNKFILYFMWPFQIILNFPKMLQGIAHGDSFYAKSLEFFYLRQIKLIKNKELYIDEVKDINTSSFAYQSFFSIYLCYSLLSRRLSVLISIVIIMSGYAIFVEDKVLLIMLISVSSAASYYFIAERGNYQFIPLAISIFLLMPLFYYGFSWYVLLLVLISSLLSISIALIQAIFFISILIFTNDSSYIHGLIAICLGVCINTIINFYVLKLHTKNITNLFQSLIKVLSVINGSNEKNNKNKNMREISFSRPIIIKNGAISVLPFFLLINLYNEMGQLFIIYTFIVVMFVNQSKILRLFDFHLLYGFIFFYSVFLLGASEINIINVLAIFIVGTNPILIYALDKGCTDTTRGFKCSSIPMISPYQSDKILQDLALLFNSDVDSILIKPIDEIYEYNDLWSIESLFNEWLWEAIEMRGILYFPDWYSVFYSKNGKELLSCLMYDAEHLSRHNRIIVSFKNTKFNECNEFNIMIKSIMPRSVMDTTLSHLDGYCIRIEKSMQA